MKIKNWILGYKMNAITISGKDGSKNEFTGPIKEFLTNAGKWVDAGIETLLPLIYCCSYRFEWSQSNRRS
jgi:hypothetical protein